MTMFRISAALCFLAVALGAFGAHWLKPTLEARNLVDVFYKERNRVNEMIQHRLVPNIDQVSRFERWLQPMRTKRAERHRQKTKECRKSHHRSVAFGKMSVGTSGYFFFTAARNSAFG